jgi:molybdopterin synthase sulfur carrier subunit
MIKVLFFAKLREELKINELDVEYKADVGSIKELINHLRQEYQQIDNVKNIKAAVNQELALDWDLSLKDGDEVAFFPPITGG